MHRLDEWGVSTHSSEDHRAFHLDLERQDTP